jgi:hypothetical protein
MAGKWCVSAAAYHQQSRALLRTAVKDSEAPFGAYWLLGEKTNTWKAWKQNRRCQASLLCAI